MRAVRVRVGRLARRGVGCLGVAAAPVAAAAQEPMAAPPLDLAWIMRGPEIVGREPERVRWSPDGRWIHFRWLPPGTPWRETLRPYRVRAQAGAAPEPLPPALADSLEPTIADGPLSPDGARRAVTVDGDLFVVDLPSGAVRRLTETRSADEVDPSFDATGSRLFFRRDGNLFSLDLATGATRQHTDIRPGPADTGRTSEGQRAFLEREERALVEAVRDRLWRDSVEKAEREAREARRGAPLHLGREERVTAIVPAPAGTVALLFTSTEREPLRTRVPAYVTPTGYTEALEVRPKVGDVVPRQRVGLLTLATGDVRWLRPVADDSTDVYAGLESRGWNDAGTSALLWVVSRDRERRLLLRVDPDGTMQALDVLSDSAWVGGPCYRCAGWLPGDRGIWFVSEADGHAHLYTVAADGNRRAQRTRGAWEVLQAQLLPSRTGWLLHTSEASPFERHAYLLPVDGGPARRLTTEGGGHQVVLSPDGRQLADLFSTANRPGELVLRSVGSGRPGVPLTTSPTEQWLAFPWIKPEIVWIDGSDGARVPARLYRPADLGARPNGAAVIFVHGAGYLHNVHHWWSSYFREYMFHHLLAQRGYAVLDIDYRGSAGYGRDWRTAIYRHMGGRDLADQVDGARWLERELGIPFDRIGIYGGSYGGFITLMALFTEGRYFGAGAALRSVTDWAHYNHPYTANILNEPQDDSVAYRRSSPIYFAEGLGDPLLIAHGMVDVNVHFQDVVRLAQRLIELGKTDWELAVYPVEYHAFVRPDSWTDEFRRILELFDEALHPRP